MGPANPQFFWSEPPSSTDSEENLYIILVITSGVVVFFYCIGTIQLESKSFLKKKQKIREIERWIPFKMLSEDVQWQVKGHLKQYPWQETKGVNVEYLLKYLPRDLGRRISRQLCLEILKEVEEFRRWSETSLVDICGFVKPVFFHERTRIIRQGNPIDEMLFVLQGKLWTYTTAVITNSSPANDNRSSKRKYLKNGDFCGEELVNWAQNYDTASDLPISTRTIHALTDVEAFVLTADDLQNVYVKYNSAARFIESFFRFRRNLRSRRNTQISIQEGTQPR